MAKEYQSTSLSHKEKRLLKKASGEKKKTKKEKKVQPVEVDQDDSEVEQELDSQLKEQGVDLNVLDDSEDSDSEGETLLEDAKESLSDEEDVAYSDVEFDDDADVVPHSKLTINNNAALKEALKRIQIDWDKYSFDEAQAITYKEAVQPKIKDIYDDTERELQFFQQGLEAAKEGRAKLLALRIPFSRPADYFAEMVKSDEHMEKLKLGLIQDATEKKAKEESKRQRQLKKYGKQVQQQTMVQRHKEKRETLDRISHMKKRRGDQLDTGMKTAFGDDDEHVSQKKRRIQHQVMSKKGGKGGKSRPGKNRRSRKW